MTQKERKLTAVVAGIFGVMLVYMLVQRLLIGPIVDLRTQISGMQAERERLVMQTQAEDRYRRLWSQLTFRTFSSDKATAAGKLDLLIKDVLAQSGLQKYSVNPGDAKPSKDKLYSVITYTVSGAEGTMEDFARFLHLFYQQPYAMQINGFRLEPVTYRKSNTLRVSGLVIEALLLLNDGMPASFTTPVASVATGPASQLHGSASAAGQSVASATAPAIPGRPKSTDLDAYAILWNKKFMEPYTPPKPEPPKPPPAAVAMPMISPGGGPFTGPMDVRITSSTPGATIRYTTDGTNPNPTTGQDYNGSVRMESPGMVRAIAYTSDDRASAVAMATFSVPPPPPMKLIMLDMYGHTDDHVREAVIVNEQTNQRQIIQEGDTFDGGKLLYVLSYAAIVEMPDGPRYIYKVGKSFQDREILDPNRQPDVWRDVQELKESG